MASCVRTKGIIIVILISRTVVSQATRRFTVQVARDILVWGFIMLRGSEGCPRGSYLFSDLSSGGFTALDQLSCIDSFEYIMLEVEFMSGHSKGLPRLFVASDLKLDSKHARHSNLGAFKGGIVSSPWGCFLWGDKPLQSNGVRCRNVVPFFGVYFNREAHGGALFRSGYSH